MPKNEERLLESTKGSNKILKTFYPTSLVLRFAFLYMQEVEVCVVESVGLALDTFLCSHQCVQ